jgi:hypothetical protein
MAGRGQGTVQTRRGRLLTTGYITTFTELRGGKLIGIVSIGDVVKQSDIAVRVIPLG